jgi:hypothetical protein
MNDPVTPPQHAMLNILMDPSATMIAAVRDGLRLSSGADVDVTTASTLIAVVCAAAISEAETRIQDLPRTRAIPSHSEPRMEVRRSTLLASGETQSDPELVRWTEEVAGLLRHALGSGSVELRLWGYRHQVETLCADFWNEAGEVVPVTFFATGAAIMKNLELEVPDITEALHAVGLICRRIAVKAEIGYEASPL